MLIPIQPWHDVREAPWDASAILDSYVDGDPRAWLAANFGLPTGPGSPVPESAQDDSAPDLERQRNMLMASLRMRPGIPAVFRVVLQRECDLMISNGRHSRESAAEISVLLENILTTDIQPRAMDDSELVVFCAAFGDGKPFSADEQARICEMGVVEFSECNAPVSELYETFMWGVVEKYYQAVAGAARDATAGS